MGGPQNAGHARPHPAAPLLAAPTVARPPVLPRAAPSCHPAQPQPRPHLPRLPALPLCPPPPRPPRAQVVTELGATVKVLDASGCSLTQLPPDISRLTNLTRLVLVRAGGSGRAHARGQSCSDAPPSPARH
jgi:hypothetical protein